MNNENHTLYDLYCYFLRILKDEMLYNDYKIGLEEYFRREANMTTLNYNKNSWDLCLKSFIFFNKTDKKDKEGYTDTFKHLCSVIFYNTEYLHNTNIISRKNIVYEKINIEINKTLQS